MPSSIRIADLLLLFLITQTAQAGPVGRAERFFRRDWNTTSSAVNVDSVAAESSITSDPTEAASSAVSVTAQEEQDGVTPSPIFVTLDGTTTDTPDASRPARTTPLDIIPSTTPVPSTADSQSTLESQILPTTTSRPMLLPPIFSTISLPPHLTSGLQNESYVHSSNIASTSTSASASESLTQSISTPHTTSPLSTPVEGDSSVAAPTVSLQSSLSFGFPIPGETTTVATAISEQLPSSTLAPVLSSTTANTEASSPASSTAISPSSTTVSPVRPAPETTSSGPATPSATITLSSPSSALKVTGTPNNQVPTIRTSTPAASTTVSPEVAANNLASAKTFNSLFDSLNENSACAAGQIACVKGNIGLCGPDGAFAIQSCGAGTSCFALPMKTTEGVIVGCYDPEVASGILGTPASVSVPISSTAAPEAPSASGVVSEVTTTITPTIIATYTVSVGPPAVPDASFATPVPGFTTTVVVTKTVEPAPTPSSTTAEEEEEPTATSTSRRRTITSTAEEETSTSKSTRAESTTSELTTVETTQQTSRSTPTPSTTPASTSTTATGTDTDTLIVSPIPTDEPSEPPAVALVTVVFGPSASRETIAGGTPKRKADPTTSASLPPGIGVPQGTPILTVFVTVTQKERETVTVTVTKD
ncbi:Prefoldin subunit [Colletotrichum higginsianum IMI 349063]|uniref:Prefoldin subunit n=3 Tax=Colletotrichum higginsianum TaxID=80884 RepID=A0A1B7YVE9_COLHI|nr:Prefoldin subunit [Colletotrichum higginsianum IMI 349063]OBR16017.1 Prefoldin subunit [Colletotrichum higginsianum IMI 349063]